jgi:hypothetical protein
MCVCVCVCYSSRLLSLEYIDMSPSNINFVCSDVCITCVSIIAVNDSPSNPQSRVSLIKGIPRFSHLFLDNIVTSPLIQPFLFSPGCKSRTLAFLHLRGLISPSGAREPSSADKQMRERVAFLVTRSRTALGLRIDMRPNWQRNRRRRGIVCERLRARMREVRSRRGRVFLAAAWRAWAFGWGSEVRDAVSLRVRDVRV